MIGLKPPTITMPAGSYTTRWDTTLEALKRAERLPPNFHGRIMSNGDYVNPQTGQVIGNIFDYVP